MSSDAVEDYCKARTEQFNLITKSAYIIVVAITLFAIAMCFT